MKKELSILNWHEYQARTDKELPWLKLWGKLFTRIWWQELKDSEKVIPIIFLDVARRTNNKLPRNPAYYIRNYNLNMAPKSLVLVCSSLYKEGFLSDYLVGHLSDSSTLIYSPSNLKDLKNNEAEKKSFGESGKVLLSEEEFSKLVAQYGASGVEEKITRLENYMLSKGKTYKSHYHTILNWASRDGAKSPDRKIRGLADIQETAKRIEEELRA